MDIKPAGETAPNTGHHHLLIDASPVLVGAGSYLTGSPRLSILSVIVLFAAGSYLLMLVDAGKERRHRVDLAQKRARKRRQDVCSTESRDMKIQVECHAGYRGEEEPRAFTLGERRFAVIEILDRWMAPDHRYFKVQADDGRKLVLRHDTASGDWELAGLVGPERAAPAGGKTLH